MRDGDVERPVLSEMAEKLRRARSAGFHDFEEPDAVGAPPAERAAEPVERSEPPAETIRPPGGQDAGGSSGSLQASMRLDSIERRLFDLRAALDELAAGQPGTVPDAAGSHTPTDAEAWIAFAAAAVRRGDDAAAQAEIADELLAEFRKRRARGGVLGNGE